MQVAANLLTDDYLMRSYQLTPEYRPLVDYHADLSPVQGNKGWRFGYSDALVDSTADFRPFKYKSHSSGQIPDGRWMINEVIPLAELSHSMPHMPSFDRFPALLVVFYVVNSPRFRLAC